MIRPPPKSTRTDTRFPYTTLFRSATTCGPCAGIRRGPHNFPAPAGHAISSAANRGGPPLGKRSKTLTFDATTQVLVRRLLRDYPRHHVGKIAAAVPGMVVVAACAGPHVRLVQPTPERVVGRAGSLLCGPDERRVGNVCIER